MISACETQDFVPYGRNYCLAHPGKLQLQTRGLSAQVDHGVPLVKALKDISIQDTSKREVWKMRQSDDAPGCDEELYISGSTVVWSKGSVEGGRTVIKSFTIDSPVQEVLWCKFLLPKSLHEARVDEDPSIIPSEVQKGVCIVESSAIHIFTVKGQEYTASLPFQVAHTWVIQNGLLFERSVAQAELASPKRPSQSLPVLFSMLHPLDEIAPVIHKTGVGGMSKVAYLTDDSHHIVFSCEDPSMLLMYDSVMGVHSIWNIRRAKPEECFMVCGQDTTSHLASHLQPSTPIPGMSQSISGHSRLTLSSQSPSLGSPFRSYSHSLSSRVNSPGGPLSRTQSPSLTHMATLSRSQSPSMSATTGSLHRYYTPSPGGAASSPAAMISRTPISHHNISMLNETMMEPAELLAPDVCLEHVWTETPTHRDGTFGKAVKAFLTTDLCGQRYICYLLSSRHQLRCVKFEESNDRSQLIFGAVSTLSARDAISLPEANMMIILDISCNLVLYTGTTKVNKIHVANIPMVNLNMSSLGMGRPSLPFDSPRPGLMTSSRPTSALEVRFDEGVNLLSPVPTEMNDSSQLLDMSLTDEFSFQPGGLINGVRDPVGHKLTVELTSGALVRTSIPVMTTSPIISTCLEALKHVLPKDVAIQVLVRWYSTHNAPGSVANQSEWIQFIKCLLTMMGYDISKLSLTLKYVLDSSLSPVIAAKKPKPSDQGSDEDWKYLLGSEHHLHAERMSPMLGLTPAVVAPAAHESTHSACHIDNSALLFLHIPAVMYALHLVYEEEKIESLHLDELDCVAALLHQLAQDLESHLYTDYYCRDYPALFLERNHHSQVTPDHLKQMQYPSFLSKDPPSVQQWLYDYIKGAEILPFPYLPQVSKRTTAIISLYIVLLGGESGEISWDRYLRRVSAAGRRATVADISLLTPNITIATTTAHERAVLHMAKMGLSMKDPLPFGLALPLREAIFHCRRNPPADWPEEAYILIGREDLSKQSKGHHDTSWTAQNKEVSTSPTKTSKDEEDGMDGLDKDLLRLRFPDDLRIQEVRRLLQSSKPVRVALTQRPEVSDHDFIEEQERHLYATCIRTMALPMGRGMFTLCSYHPVVTETLPIPKLCLTGRAPPRNTAVDLSHIDTPHCMSAWPQFHNGAAAGLRIANSSQIDSTWITYNKPKSHELNNEHAGFLMALGLNGHLSNLATMNVHDYLCKGHEMTSVGLLLGIAAAKRGTMDVATTKLLSIHVSALLPPTSTELDVPHIVQVAAVLGVGLVYQGTAHRHMAEVLLSEIGRPPGPEMENCNDRESYSLASALALGLVMLRKGSEVLGLSDLSMADQLYHYMVGGHKRPLTGANKERYKSPSYQIKEGDSVNVDVTAPGATLALGMMFFNTHNSAVAEWLTAPDTQFLLDFVRPDFLMLRLIARGLVMWDFICPSSAWIKSNIPEIVSKYAFRKDQFRDDPDCDIDFETMSQAYCNLIAGACMTIGLKFAGSANKEAFNVLMEHIKKVMKVLSKPGFMEQAGRSTIENCLCVALLGLAMVMAGTGDLKVLRMCRHLRSRVGGTYNYVLYGSHQAISMAIGLLFLGGGRYTLGTSPEAVAAMLCAFYPKFPTHSNDNRYHLQAFRHLYVLAAEPRILIPLDVDTGKPCYVPIKVKFKKTPSYPSQTFETMAPYILPELSLLEQVETHGPRYWPVKFLQNGNWSNLKNILEHSGKLFVKQRAGHLSYVDDPKGYRSLLAQNLTSDQSSYQVIKPDMIKSFSSDASILIFAELFCQASSEEEYSLVQLVSSVLHKCVTQEKPEILSTHLLMDQVVRHLPRSNSVIPLGQIKLVMAFYQRLQALSSGNGTASSSGSSSSSQGVKAHLIQTEFLAAVKNRIEVVLADWQTGGVEVLCQYLRGEEISEKQCHLLASFLTWYNVPHPSALAMINTGDGLSFPVFYRQMQSLGLSVATAMSLFNVLKANR